MGFRAREARRSWDKGTSMVERARLDSEEAIEEQENIRRIVDAEVGHFASTLIERLSLEGKEVTDVVTKQLEKWREVRRR